MLREPLHSIVIAQTMGLFFIIMAVIMLTKADYYRTLMSKLNADSGYISLSATFALLWGLLIISIHSIWADRYEILITGVAWLIIVKSVLWLALPDWMLRVSKKMYAGASYYWLSTLVGIAGVLLLSHSYALYMHW